MAMVGRPVVTAARYHSWGWERGCNCHCRSRPTPFPRLCRCCGGAAAALGRSRSVAFRVSLFENGHRLLLRSLHELVDQVLQGPTSGGGSNDASALGTILVLGRDAASTKGVSAGNDGSWFYHDLHAHGTNGFFSHILLDVIVIGGVDCCCCGVGRHRLWCIGNHRCGRFGWWGWLLFHSIDVIVLVVGTLQQDQVSQTQFPSTSRWYFRVVELGNSVRIGQSKDEESALDVDLDHLVGELGVQDSRRVVASQKDNALVVLQGDGRSVGVVQGFSGARMDGDEFHRSGDVYFGVVHGFWCEATKQGGSTIVL